MIQDKKQPDSLAQFEKAHHMYHQEADLADGQVYFWHNLCAMWEDVIKEMDRGLAVRASYIERLRGLGLLEPGDDGPLDSDFPLSSVN